MPRVLCIDYGTVRCGIAVTDPFQIIATTLVAVEAKAIMNFLKDYMLKEPVERILIGLPKNLDDSETHATAPVEAFMKRMQKEFPLIPIETIDERYTSKMAVVEMIRMGLKKKERQKKSNKDIIAATMMLQEWLTKK